MSYTGPKYPAALPRLAAASPDAFVIYAVRDPLERALSHYRLLRQYFAREEAETFGEALRTNPVYLGASDYEFWLQSIYSLFPPERVLITPFVVTTSGEELIEVACGQLGLEPVLPEAEDVEDYKNEVVQFRSGILLSARRALMRSGAYPWLRHQIGGRRMRRLRSLATKEAPRLQLEHALSTCDAAQVQQIRVLCRRSSQAVTEALLAQDRRLSLSWGDSWELSTESALAAAEFVPGSEDE